VLGFTYNFANQSTQYQNGVDMHPQMSPRGTSAEHVIYGAVRYERFGRLALSPPTHRTLCLEDYTQLILLSNQPMGRVNANIRTGLMRVRTESLGSEHGY
jgi:hypothetical protein